MTRALLEERIRKTLARDPDLPTGALSERLGVPALTVRRTIKRLGLQLPPAHEGLSDLLRRRRVR